MRRWGACALVGLAAPAWAQEGGFDARGFHAAGHAGYPLGWVTLETPDPGWEGAASAGVVFDYADDPLVEVIVDDTIPVLDQLLTANLVVGGSILGAARVDVVMPVVLFGVDQIGTFAAPGDARLQGTVGLVDRARAGVGVSVSPMVWLPTGATARYVGDAGVGFGGVVSAGAEAGPIGFVVNAGARTGPSAVVRNIEWGTNLLGGVGVALRADDQTSIGGEVRGAPSVGAGTYGFPVEGLVHVRRLLPGGLWATVGGGAGLSGGVGASRFRVLAGFGWRAPGTAPDTDVDGDGVVDRNDKCLTVPEDVDGFHDLDGCPDLDDDNDEVLDVDDACRLEPEDLDGLLDGDGCPEADADSDSLADLDDDCPLEPEDVDGFEDGDGCPELSDLRDRDGDGVPDVRDLCPDVPIRPGQDPATSDGCPKLAEISANRIVITDRIYFAEGSAVLLDTSTPVLEAVAALLREHPEITDVLVEGHTNDIGDDAFNYGLSERRAAAVVDWLVRSGIDRNRLASKGYGETRPVVPNDSDEHRAQNRRVDFTIVSRQ
jgi:outer membrane protein OmpA-like peptidoglycan-associated protein